MLLAGNMIFQGGTCFVDVMIELRQQCDMIGYKPEYIFLASSKQDNGNKLQIILNGEHSFYVCRT